MGHAGSKISAQDRAILDLKTQRDQLQQYQRRITVLTDRETEIARECLRRRQKSKALLALRRKKYQESLLAQTDQQLEQLQKLTSDVEFAAVQKDVLFGLQQGTRVLKQIHAEMGGIQHVDKLMEENAAAQAYQQEITDLLGGQLSNAAEEEVEDELQALEQETRTPGVRLPYAPTEPLPNRPAQQEAEPSSRRQPESEAIPA